MSSMLLTLLHLPIVNVCVLFWTMSVWASVPFYSWHLFQSFKFHNFGQSPLVRCIASSIFLMQVVFSCGGCLLCQDNLFYFMYPFIFFYFVSCSLGFFSKNSFHTYQDILIFFSIFFKQFLLLTFNSFNRAFWRWFST